MARQKKFMLKTAMILFKNNKISKINDFINTILDRIENNDNEIHVLNSNLDINHNLISYNKIIFVFEFKLFFSKKYKKLINNYINKQNYTDNKEIYAVLLKYNIFDTILLKKIIKYLEKKGLSISKGYLFDINKHIVNKEFALI